MAFSYTFEVAPVFTLMEKIVLDEMLKLIGFPDGDAIFCPGELRTGGRAKAGRHAHARTNTHTHARACTHRHTRTHT